jgi:hypothetical protein
MNATYYLQLVSNDISDNGMKECRLYAVIDEVYFWAIEWKANNDPPKSEIIDFNSGFMSDTIKEACLHMTVVLSPDLRNSFGSFADYVERAVSGFRSYISWITPDAEVNAVTWQIQNKLQK